jgi:hypothetical protein
MSKHAKVFGTEYKDKDIREKKSHWTKKSLPIKAGSLFKTNFFTASN